MPLLRRRQRHLNSINLPNEWCVIAVLGRLDSGRTDVEPSFGFLLGYQLRVVSVKNIWRVSRFMCCLSSILSLCQSV